MTTLEEIRRSIGILPHRQREELARWLLSSAGGGRVEEAALDYGAGKAAHMPVEEYLRREEASPVKHEYVAGEVFAMSGASVRHAMIVDNLTWNFRNHLHGSPCAAFSSGVKVRLQVDRDEVFYYPDVTVACGPQEPESYFLSHSKLIAEVLSPSTETIDRREKRLNYRNIATLEEYVLVSQRLPQVAIYRRAEEWAPRILSSLESVAELRSIGLDLTLERIYEGSR